MRLDAVTNRVTGLAASSLSDFSSFDTDWKRAFGVMSFGGDAGDVLSCCVSVGLVGSLSLFVGVVLVGDVSVFVAPVLVAFAGGARASGETIAVASGCVLFGVGGITVVGAKDNFVCFGPPELVYVAVDTLVCLDLMPPLGDSSLPLVLVDFRLVLLFFVMVAHVASVR